MLRVLHKFSRRFLPFKCAASLLVLPGVESPSIILTWEPNQEHDLAGYRIYYGKESRQYDASISVGNVTSFEITGLEPGQRYFLALTAIDLAGNESEFSAELSIEFPGLEPEDDVLISGFYNYPNPMKARQEPTRIRYHLKRSSAVTIEIFDLENRLVKRIIDDVAKGPGEHIEDIWDGTNRAGRYVANGIYFCRIRADDKEHFTKIAVTR